MLRLSSTHGLLLTLALAGCAKESAPPAPAAPAPASAPAAAEPAAKVVEPGAAATTDAVKINPGAYALDAAHSFALFKVRHFNAGYVYGRFDKLDGRFQVDADPTKSTVEIHIKSDSVDTNEPKRDAHLKSPDFFNAAQFPEITFKSTAVAAPGADGWAKVTGYLTIRGLSKPVTLDVRPLGAGVDPMKTYRVGFEAKGTVDRRDFGMGFMPGALGDQVELILAVEGTPAK